MLHIEQKLEKKKNQQFYTMKFKSLRLKEFDYDIQITPSEARENGEMISLFDNQFLRSVRKITNREFDKKELQELEQQKEEFRSQLFKNKDDKKIIRQINKLQNKIDDMLFIEEYVTIIMEHNSHYDYLYKNGLKINDRKFIRFSCSAGQARVSTVTFVEEETAKELKKITDNGRDLEAKFSPSKLNAYIGLGGSATQVVSMPRFCVIPDYISSLDVKVNFVTETPSDQDDKIEEKTIALDFERFDGMGLVSPYQSEKWANELGLDYIPAQWCIRQSFLKGMLCTFDFHLFCKEINNKNYNIKTCYKDENGKDAIVDLRDIDVICTTSQFKLWKSYKSLDQYIENCEKNDLKWGVSLYTPKEDKDILTMNYQFLQTLNLDDKDVKEICKQSVEWIQGVNGDDIYYTLLFLLGGDITEEKISEFLTNGGNYWAKSLMLDHELINDKYIRKNIYDLIKKKIRGLCLGSILLDGNFQVLVSDPFAFMEFACGRPVKGLLGEREYYSNYWNNKDVKLVDSMRAPLTSRFEHFKLPLVKNENAEKWYKYCYTGVLVNVHGTETLNWAGSDWDYDIIATTSDKTVLKGVYENEIPVVYEAPKPESKILTEDDLFESDKFSFGSIIGSITNKSTSAYALLPLLKNDGEEYNITMNRIRMCTKLQSAQIDKAKIGREVKGIPNTWLIYQKINKNDSDEIRQAKELNNKTLLNKHPYFFRYLYRDTNERYKKHNDGYDITCRQKFNMSLEELINKKRRSETEREFLEKYYEYLPIIDSDSTMNMICKHIESIDFDIRNKIKDKGHMYEKLKSKDVDTKEQYKYLFINVNKTVKELMQELRDLKSLRVGSLSNNIGSSEERKEKDCLIEDFRRKLLKKCPNKIILVDILIDIFYIHNNYNKALLWSCFGKQIFENIKNRQSIKTVKFPMPNKDGNIKYLNNNFKLDEVIVW